MMMLEAARLRSPSGRKLTTGLAILSSRKTRVPSPSDEQDGQRLDLPEGVVVPVPLLPLAEQNSPSKLIARASSPRPM